MKSNNSPVVLITGAAKRIGKVIAETLHQKGFSIIIHYRQSELEAMALADTLNQSRKNSAIAIKADLGHLSEIPGLIEQSLHPWGRLDVLINNASLFFPTNLQEESSEENWNLLLNANLKAPYFLSLDAAPHLKKQAGCIINISDIHGNLPLKNYPIYSISKAGLNMLTKALAKELAPVIRVNAIAPGPTWCEEEKISYEKLVLIKKTALEKLPIANHIAEGVLFLIKQSVMTGEIITIDAGRSLRR